MSNHAPAQQLCTSCHKYHTSDRPQLFPGNAGPFGAGSGYTYSMPTWGGTATNWQAPKPATSAFPSTGGRVVVGTVQANALDFTDRSSPSSGQGFGTAGDNTGTTGLCNACHRDHIPGAAYFDHERFSDPANPYTCTMLPDDVLIRKIGEAGI